MVFLVNIFLLAAFGLVLKEGSQLFLAARLAKEGGTSAVLCQLRETSPAVSWFLLVFLVLWAYSLVDALLGKGDDRECHEKPPAEDI